MARVDIGIAVVVMLLCAVIVYGVSGLAYWTRFSPGPAFLPCWVAGAGLLLALLLLIEALRGRASAKPANLPDRTGVQRVLLALTGLWGFVVLSPWLGFVLGAAALTLWLLIVVQRAPIVPSLLCAAFITGLVYGVFVAWFGMSLPRGVFGI